MKKLLQKIIGYLIPMSPLRVILCNPKYEKKTITTLLGFYDGIDVSDSEGVFLTIQRNVMSITLTFTKIVEKEAGSESDKEHPVQPG